MVAETKKEMNDLEVAIKHAIPNLAFTTSKDKYKELLESIQDTKKLYVSLVPKVISVMEMGVNGEVDKMLAQLSQLEMEESKLDQKLSDLVDKIQSFTLKAAVTAEAHERKAVQFISLAFLIAVLVGLILPKLIATSIATPIINLNTRLTELAEGDGDLRIRLNDKGKDETLTMFANS
ncbi:hypothetical protein AT00_19805 [Pseudoalteromonas lipolytica SCSIO 04301]|uniref:hypothetical protein n=1 Tax=Pseudoalteromonas lipolytica TaxID=570156 RepID=UPI00044DDE21|nr:hypothetical protein [Pseudoalteromonas lipolytica]EWH04470.1 hypothetical protein AT00_19805 [Pseudoalteromonas lipolytica SCSIO 04301]